MNGNLPSQTTLPQSLTQVEKLGSWEQKKKMTNPIASWQNCNPIKHKGSSPFNSRVRRIVFKAHCQLRWTTNSSKKKQKYWVVVSSENKTSRRICWHGVLHAKSIRTALRVRWNPGGGPAVFSYFCINHAIWLPMKYTLFTQSILHILLAFCLRYATINSLRIVQKCCLLKIRNAN